ncbi:hypothetical protein P775_03445 [Puniceibacterium antarcticum]|uniref:Uncharacterized protein n=1 Tax=Puniceibacterium antarcticum TaxID=1206336 RepID=A0A2G8RJ76_9RHOB|nr:hypothetical protein [Puniceibacterium antarcticum]PIL21619.1 hypothetical protein P775_03445 [Puniceibacterium antarcticum]
MLESVALIEELDSGKQITIGLHHFAAIPARGNRVILANKIGGLVSYEVVAIEHTPVRAGGQREAAGKTPSCAIYLKMLDPMYDEYLKFQMEIHD